MQKPLQNRKPAISLIPENMLGRRETIAGGGTGIDASKVAGW